MKSTVKDWDDVRSAFATSIMVDTSLHSLAQNLDGPGWPIQSKDDTPATVVIAITTRLPAISRTVSANPAMPRCSCMRRAIASWPPAR